MELRPEKVQKISNQILFRSNLLFLNRETLVLKEYEKLELEKELEEKNIQKIAVLGLGNAGKTSIVKTVLYQFEALMTLAPTKSVERTSIEFLGRELLIWDFGGQERYRQNYLLNPAKYFQGIRFIYYIVDSQDPKNLRESIAYFISTFEKAINHSPDAKIYLFFHKIDPNYSGEMDYAQVENDFLEEVLPKIQTKAKDPPTIFHTSIHDPMSVISAFAQPMLSNQDIYETLGYTIAQFCKENDLNFGILFTRNFFNIGNYSEPSRLQSSIKNLSAYLKEFDLEGFDGKFPEFSVGFNQIYTTKFFITVGEEFPFYFCIGVNTLAKPKDIAPLLKKVEEFTANLKIILRNSEIIRIGVLRTDQINTKT